MNVMRMFDLTAKVAVITGAGDGPGLQFAAAMAEAGAHVTSLDLAADESTITTGLMWVTDGGCMSK